MIPEIELLPNPDTGELIQEEWRDIAGYEGIYEVSNYGRVKSLGRKIVMDSKRTREQGDRILTNNIGNVGYPRVAMRKNNSAKLFCVHSLVAKTFIPNPNKLCDVNHKDGNRANPMVSNLEWVSRRENATHGFLKRKKHSKYPGVTFVKRRTPNAKDRWKSVLFVNGKHKFLGKFDTEIQAYQAYLIAIDKHGVVNKYVKVA